MLSFLLLLMTYWIVILGLGLLGKYAVRLLGKVYNRLCDRFSEERILRVIAWLVTTFVIAIGATVVTIAIYQVHNA